jgi:hypothetical protein
MIPLGLINCFVVNNSLTIGAGWSHVKGLLLEMDFPVAYAAFRRGA